MKEQVQETWQQIWTRKGRAEGGLDNLLAYDGYEATKVDMEEVAYQITRRLNLKPDDTVLEVGCGAGALAQYLDCRYVGIDYSHTLVEKHIELLHHSVLVGGRQISHSRTNPLTMWSATGYFSILTIKTTPAKPPKSCSAWPGRTY